MIIRFFRGIFELAHNDWHDDMSFLKGLLVMTAVLTAFTTVGAVGPAVINELKMSGLWVR